jgi:2-desacetyl-2-hydroxyethyl bacteriochlorophyllide A dehydrogenase
MTAAVFLEPGKMQVEERPTPEPGPGQILIRVKAAGVCATDLHIFHGKFPAAFPVVPGHEFAGIVEKAGPGVQHVRAGDLVSVDPVIPCGACDYCHRSKPHLCVRMRALGVDLDGGHATHCLAPAENAYPAANLLPEEAALAEPLACVLHGLDLADVRAGDRVAIIGAGWIGLLMLQCVRLRGAARIIVSEIVARKRELAERLGADVVVDPRERDLAQVVREEMAGGADAAIECVGSRATAEQAMTLVRDGGTIMFFGVAPPHERIQVSPYEIYRRELKVVGSFSTPKKHAAALELLAGKRLEIQPLITGRFGLDELGRAMELLQSGQAVKNLIVVT